MFRISFIPIFIFHQKNPWWRWGPDLGPLLDTPISRPLVLLTVFFSAYIMSRACILTFKTALKPMLNQNGFKAVLNVRIHALDMI